jgi:hypothetical protein
MMVLKNKDVATFLEENASIVSTGGNRYLFLPYWFKSTNDPTKFEILHWDSLPKDLKDFVQAMREGENL